MILVFFKQLNQQLQTLEIRLKEITLERDELKRKLYGKPKNERKKVTKPKTNTRKTRNPNRITLDKTELE